MEQFSLPFICFEIRALIGDMRTQISKQSKAEDRELWRRVFFFFSSTALSPAAQVLALPPSMDRLQFIMLAFPIFLLCSDLVNLYSRPPPPPPPRSPPHLAAVHHHHHHPPPVVPQVPDFPSTEGSSALGNGYGTIVEFKFCVSCSYRGAANSLKQMLEESFPGINVVLSNYPPSLPKRLLSKAFPIVQAGFIGIIVAGEHLLPRLGILNPPSWYFSLRANKFRTIASSWLLGNFLQSTLQSSGAFEVFCNGDLVFSKLDQKRFPDALELKNLIGNRLPSSAFGKNLNWS